jgi:hypothetical protein
VRLRGLSFRVDRLVEVDPENSGEKRYRQDKGNEQDNCPDRNLVYAPCSHAPEYQGDYQNGRQRQAVTDVHGAKKVAFLALKLQVANRTVVVHSRKAAVNGRAKDFTASAPGA